MNEEHAEVEASATAAVRTAVAVAAQLAQQIARMREQSAREAEAASAQRAREFQARLDAERAAAHAALAPLAREDWWQRADQEQIMRAYEVAHAWEEIDAPAREHADRLREEISQRYGVDALNPHADPERVRAEMARVESERAAATRLLLDDPEGRERDALKRQDQADTLEADPPGGSPEDLAERAAEHDRHIGTAAGDTAAANQLEADAGDVEYDSATRRAALAQRLDEHGIDPEARDARLTADKGYGAPAAQAVVRPKRTVGVRKGSMRGAAQQREHPIGL